jgi:hypothetical protein
MKIAVCVPHNYSHFEKPFTISLLEIFVYTNAWITETKQDIDLSFLTQDGFLLDQMRNLLVQTAIESDQTHILFLDTDMTFPRNVVKLMVEDFRDNPEADVVSGLYTWKKPPFLPHVYPTYDEDKKNFRVGGQFPLTSPFWVAASGTGCLMIKTDFLKKFDPPWFLFERDVNKKPLGAPIIGEDLYFFRECRPKTLCDPRISCKHYKSNGYSIDDYIDSNGIKRTEDGNFQTTSEQITEIADKQKKNTI